MAGTDRMCPRMSLVAAGHTDVAPADDGSSAMWHLHSGCECCSGLLF